MILSVTPNPCVDKTVFLDEMAVGKKNVARRVTCIPGGKGNNVARVVKALGGQSAALVLVGGAPGQHVVDMIERDDGVTCHPVWVAEQTRTITTVLEETPHRQTPLFEPGPRVTPAERDAFVAAVLDRLPDIDVLTLNGTVPDPILADAYAEIIPEANAAGIYTILDTHGPELALGVAARPFMVKPNETEAAELVGFPLDSDEARWRAVACFHDHGIRLVALSLGAEGLLLSDGRERLRVTPPLIDEVNAVGSGDALVGAMALGLLEMWPLDRLATWGASAGAVNAMQWDIGRVTRPEVEALAGRVTVKRC